MEGYTILGSILLRTVNELEKRRGRITTYKDIFEINSERRSAFIYNKSSVSSTDDMVEGCFLFNRIFLDDL